MTVHGVVDIRSNHTQNTANYYQEVYVTIYNFLTSSLAQVLGCSRIAYSTGSGGTGTSLDYWDTVNSTGDNVWSVWKFVSSSIPFYMLMQMSRASNFGAAVPGAPAVFNSFSSQNGVGFVFALRNDGGNPWNGTTNNNGADTKSQTLVWTSGSSTLQIFPRSNAFGGTHASQKQNVQGMNSTGGGAVTAATRTHFVMDENNIMILYDDTGDGSYRGMHFGKYIIRSGTNPAAPYAGMHNTTDANDPFIVTNAVYGATGGGFGGGICHPWIAASSTYSVSYAGLNEFWAATFAPNTALPNTQFDEFPIICAINESPFTAMCGQLDYNFIRYVYGVDTHDTNVTMTRAVFGAATTNTTKISIPWNGVAPPGTYNSRSGTVF